MRSGLVAWIALITLGAGGAIASCSSEPNNNVVTGTTTGPGGAGGNGGATSTATSTTTTTSTGPMNSCQQACDHAASCGLDLCSFAMIDCANPDPAADCYAQCVLDANCLQILSLLTMNPDAQLVGCLTGCQGGMGGGGGGQQCQTCLLQTCLGEVMACQQDPICQQWGMCVQGCADQQCYMDCNNQFPGAANSYNAIYTCLCNGCSTPCAAIDPCGLVGSGAGGAGGAGTGGTGGVGGN